MNKSRILCGITAVAVLLGLNTGALAYGKKTKRKEATFRVRIENVSGAEGQPTDGGVRYPFALSPGLFVVTASNSDFFKVGKKANAALEAQAEDGNPEALSKKLLTKVGSVSMGIFNKPVGTDMPAPILPGGVYEFTFKASEGMKLNLISMFGQSNDLFYAPRNAIELFDSTGDPLTGDITGDLLLWDAGTEVNQAPGIGPDQAPRQKKANSGAAENGVVGAVKDSFIYPDTRAVIRVTISVE